MSFPTQCLINGQATHCISIFDRGFFYGQSLFETIAVKGEQCCLLNLHIERLVSGAKRLYISLTEQEISQLISECHQLALGIEKGVIKVIISVAEKGRGYLTPSHAKTQRVVMLSEPPKYQNDYWRKGIKLGLSDVRLSHQPLLAGMKHSNRLEQIFVRHSWQDSWQEALVLDKDDWVIEATQSNIFFIKDKQLITPDLSLSGVAGVMRQYILSTAKSIGLHIKITNVNVADIMNADEVFVSNSLIGLWFVNEFNDCFFNDFDLSQQLLIKISPHALVPYI